MKRRRFASRLGCSLVMGLSAVFFATATGLAAEDAVISGDHLQVKFDAGSRTIEISDKELGPILTGGRLWMGQGEDAPSTADEQGVAAAVVDGQIRLTVGDVFEARLSIDGEEVAVSTVAHGGKGPVAFSAQAAVSDPRIAVLADQRAEDGGVLVTTFGPAAVPAARSLFDPQRDLAITATSPADGASARWVAGEPWKLDAAAPVGSPLVSLRLDRRYYRDTLGIEYYAPLPRLTRWPTAPVVAMTWYGIKGWEGSPAQRKEWLFPNVDWVAEHLKPYAGDNLVFQLDDNYPLDDKVMREFSDYIRSKGLVPGIWFTPYVVAPKSEAEKHPDWFIRDKAGNTIPAFGGITYGKRSSKSTAVLNVNNAEAVKAWYGMWWHKASDTWNFDFFKIDGQPQVVAAYRKSVGAGGVDGYRKGLKIARDIAGPDKFINACWGTPVEAIGLVNGSRTGPDTGNWPHAAEVILRWNFLNNVCWWSDPDAAANLYRATVERTRLNAQARVLTGQQFLTDDVWTDVPPEICRVWQLSFPTLDIRPVNLYKIDDWQRYDVFDLRVAKPWGTWDVVGLFNYDGTAADKDLDLGRLPLEADRVHVFEFWKSEYLGERSSKDKIPRRLEGYEGEVFAVVPVQQKAPVLISTSRHVTQGALDLESLSWERDGEKWIATGVSSHLVAGDPYELVFAAGRFRISGVKCSAPAETVRTGAVLRVRIVPKQAGEGRWQVTFSPIVGPHLAVSASTLDVRQGGKEAIDLLSLGDKPAEFQITASDPRLHVSPARGRIGPWPERAAIAVSAENIELPPGSVAAMQLTVQAEGAQQAAQQVTVRVHAPPPENLARKAKATASSMWSADYAADRAIDGNDATRWNSREGDKDGCWLELTWPEPVELNAIEIDECMDFGPRIQAWHVEAGTDKIEEIARGKQAGRHHRVKLPKPVKATRLRLTVDKASVVPTLWELKVFRFPD